MWRTATRSVRLGPKPYCLMMIKESKNTSPTGYLQMSIAGHSHWKIHYVHSHVDDISVHMFRIRIDVYTNVILIWLGKLGLKLINEEGGN